METPAEITHAESFTETAIKMIYSLSTLATKVAENGDKLSPENGNKCCRKWQQKSLFPATFVAVSGDNLSPFRATFVAVFGNYSFGYNLSPFSATFVASVDRL